MFVGKLGFTLSFLIFALKYRLWVFIRTAVLMCTDSPYFEQKYRSQFFTLKIVDFTAIKIPVYCIGMLTLSKLLLSADQPHGQFVPRSDTTKCWA